MLLSAFAIADEILKWMSPQFQSVLYYKTDSYSKTKKDFISILYAIFYIEKQIILSGEYLSIWRELHCLSQIRCIPRPLDVPDVGLICDLLWSDPEHVSIVFNAHGEAVKVINRLNNSIIIYRHDTAYSA